MYSLYSSMDSLLLQQFSARPHKFPWKYDETDRRCIALKAALTAQITKLAEAGVTDYYSGREFVWTVTSKGTGRSIHKAPLFSHIIICIIHDGRYGSNGAICAEVGKKHFDPQYCRKGEMKMLMYKQGAVSTCLPVLCGAGSSGAAA